jgi:hypothetical protein
MSGVRSCRIGNWIFIPPYYRSGGLEAVMHKNQAAKTNANQTRMDAKLKKIIAIMTSWREETETSLESKEPTSLEIRP